MLHIFISTDIEDIIIFVMPLIKTKVI